jgi:2,3-bisphosphoglycerate-dependent phosphoglycerate mutase
VAIEIVYETHSLTEDNERGIATGWRPGRLSARGRELAAELGRRRAGDGLTAVFSSDLARAAETASIAFGRSSIPVLLDWRLRECDYGICNATPAAELLANRGAHLDDPYPGGESWRQAVARVGRFLGDLPLRWSGRRVLVIGHVATRWALDHLIGGTPLEDLLAADFAWQPGWEYLLPWRRVRGG